MPISPAVFGVERFSVPAVLDVRAEEFGDRVMMLIAGTPVTFAQMRERSCAAANVLAELGIRRGQTVALFTGTCPEWVYFWLGAARIGAITAAVNAANMGEFLSHALRLSHTELVIADAERAERVDTGERVLVLGDSLSEQLNAASMASEAFEAQAGPHEVGALFFTSGTTGRSKAVVTSWQYLFTAAATVAAAWEFASGDVLWTAMPLFHLSAAPSILVPMLVGATTVLADGFHPARVWDDVTACGAVGFAGAGAMVSMLMNRPPQPRDAALGLRFISAAPIAADVYRTIEQRYGCRVVTMYGLTEAFPIAVKAVSDEGVPGTSGTVNDAFDVRIVDGYGRELPAGAVGEITCRARHPDVMSTGYVTEDATGFRVQAHPEWFHTGDLGKIDAAGHLTYIDRAKDSLRRRGENVSSVEIETVVMRHPGVAEAAAVAVPSDLTEDDILVVVTPRPGVTLDYTELLDFCAARMPYFCVPRYLEVLDEIPKNVIGRIRKDVLRNRGLTDATWDREAHGYILTR